MRKEEAADCFCAESMNQNPVINFIKDAVEEKITRSK